jgi:hypothetical protein
MKFISVRPHSLFLLTLVTTLLYGASAQIDPRLLGTWKLNLAKTTWEPGPPPTSTTVTRKQVGDVVKSTVERVEANGNRTTVTETLKYDGKDYPRSGTADADTIAVKRIDANTFEETLKKAGNVVRTGRQVLSKDGRLLTATWTGSNASGQPIHYVLVYDKQ